MQIFNSFNNLSKEFKGGYTDIVFRSQDRNPFVKIGDKVKLHSRKGTFRVLAVSDDNFVVSSVSNGWFGKSVKEYNCTWEEFCCWSRKV